MQEFQLSPETQDALNKAAQGFELSPEAREELSRVAQAAVKAFREFCDVLVVLFEKIMAEIRRIAIELARFFLKQQLLEWRIPPGIAGYIADHLYWKWSVHLGYKWFNKHYGFVT